MKAGDLSRTLIVFTDGACSGNPGPGGWGAILLGPDGEIREFGGAETQTTNNRMELSAAIAALRWARAAELPVRLYTDSTYVISGITTWLSGWKRKGWRNYEGKPVLNRDLWEELDAVLAARGAPRVSWHYVRGHTGSPGNERCDEIAVAFSKGRSPKLYSGPLSGYPCDLLDLPEDVAVPKSLFKPPKRSGGFYLSYLDGKLERHSAWSECSARVHGKSGAKFKKVSTPEEEEQTLRGWGVAG